MDCLAGGEGKSRLILLGLEAELTIPVRYINITKDGEAYLTLQLILGYICYPVAFLLGVPRADLQRVGELIGVKVIANEFVAYLSLTTEEQYINMSPRSKLIATYALCGKGFLPSLVYEPHANILLLSRFWQSWFPRYPNRCTISNRAFAIW
jgi:hypothetical protein